MTRHYSCWLHTLLRAAVAVELVAVTASMAACDSNLTPPATTFQLAPPAVYARWWAMTEACSGISAPLSSVTFFAVPNDNALPSLSDQLDGYWTPTGNRIYITAADTLDGATIRHEMLHALLHDGGHSRNQFLSACAGVVPCQPNCVADAGPPPSPDPLAVTVPPDSLVVTVTVLPPLAGVENPPGFVTFSVNAYNAASHPVIINFGFPQGMQDFPTFGYDIADGAVTYQVGIDSNDPTSWSFAAGETKHYLFDVSPGPINQSIQAVAFPAGTYGLVGEYGFKFSAQSTLTIAP